MAVLYSRRIFSQQVPGGTVVIVPLDSTVLWVVRRIDANIASALGGSVSVGDNAHAVTFWSHLFAPDPAATWASWEGRQVFEPVNQLFVSVTTVDPMAHIDVRISGYALSLP